MNILLIEDDKLIRITLSDTMKKSGYDVVVCENGKEGLSLVEKDEFDVVVTDLRLPGANGIDILKHSKELFPHREIIIMTAFATVETAVEALRLGAYDYLVKPFSPEELIHTLKHIDTFRRVLHENKQLIRRLNVLQSREIIGTSPQVRQLTETINIVSSQDFSVLINGESGTGKELAARALHTQSSRAKAPFVAVNCAVIPVTLLESELFGYEKGSFSGAAHQHIGYFERANTGTLFIDDIDDIPLPIQVKLLRALQEREIERIGGSGAIPIDIRVISASKIDLGQLVEEGAFRQDLFYRLNVVPINIPPLRERKEDIPHLLRHFLEKYGADQETIKRANALLPQLLDHTWPGNIRELENIVQRIIALPYLEKLKLTVPDSDHEQTLHEEDPSTANAPANPEMDDLLYTDYIERKSSEIIASAMKRAHGNVSNAAKLLGIPRSTLRHKLKKIQ